MVQLIRNPGHREPALTPRSVPFTKGGCLMRRRRLLSAAPMVVAVLVVVGLALALGACSAGDKEQAKVRHLPDKGYKALPPVNTTQKSSSQPFPSE